MVPPETPEEKEAKEVTAALTAAAGDSGKGGGEEAGTSRGKGKSAASGAKGKSAASKGKSAETKSSGKFNFVFVERKCMYTRIFSHDTRAYVYSMFTCMVREPW